MKLYTECFPVGVFAGVHMHEYVHLQTRTMAGAVNCELQQSSDILDLFLLPSGKALPAEVQCLLHNDHASVPKARIWKVPH